MKKVFLGLVLALSVSFAEKVLVIDVEGMTCKMCPIAVRKAVSKVNGVVWVKTSLKNRVAVVVTKDSVKKEEVLKAISKAGYRGEVIGEKEIKGD